MLYIGLIEWDSSMDPSVYLSHDLQHLRRQVATVLGVDGPQEGDTDPEAWATSHPLDPETALDSEILEWLSAFHTETTVPFYIEYAGPSTLVGVIENPQAIELPVYWN